MEMIYVNSKNEIACRLGAFKIVYYPAGKDLFTILVRKHSEIVATFKGVDVINGTLSVLNYIYDEDHK